MWPTQVLFYVSVLYINLHFLLKNVKGPFQNKIQWWEMLKQHWHLMPSPFSILQQLCHSQAQLMSHGLWNYTMFLWLFLLLGGWDHQNPCLILVVWSFNRLLQFQLWQALLLALCSWCGQCCATAMGLMCQSPATGCELGYHDPHLDHILAALLVSSQYSWECSSKWAQGEGFSLYLPGLSDLVSVCDLYHASPSTCSIESWMTLSSDSLICGSFEHLKSL